MPVLPRVNLPGSTRMVPNREGMKYMEQRTVNKTVRDFCRTWFERRDADGTMEYFTEDVNFVGTGQNEFARGKAAMEQYIRQDISEIPEPFAVDISNINDQVITESARNISVELILKNSMYQWNLRAFFIMIRDTDGLWRIRSLHVAEPGLSQRNSEHYPQTLVMEHLARQREELLNDSLPGGMMGGYLEDGFPFYFVNRQMLMYLGYNDEDEFVADIDGLIINCMHPDDRELVEGAVASALAACNEYIVEYRMKKKDGSYIWVHDLGREITAEDGRTAIASVCLDVTSQHEMQEELLHLYNNIPGAVFRCRFDEDFSVIDANDSLFEFLGYTREEFAAMGNKMSAVIYPDDLAVMTDKLNAQLTHGNTINNENRLICKDGAVKWISIKAQLFKEKDGQRHFYCVFVDITDEKRLQERENELFEKELTYFAEISAAEGIHGRINLTQNVVESYMATSDAAIARVGDSYDRTIENLADSAMDADYGEKIRKTLNRDQVLAAFENGKSDYHFEYFRRRNGSGAFWGSTSFRFCTNPENGDIIVFFYTLDITEKKMQEQLLNRIAELDYDFVTEIDISKGTHLLISYNENEEISIPRQGIFQAEIRKICDRFIVEESKAVYLDMLDFSHMKKALSVQDSYTFLVEMNTGSKEKRVKQYQVFYISRELDRVCLTRTDVTDIVRQEQRQKEALTAALAAAEQANAAKTDFLSRMSHEIRTPMNAIIGMSTIAAQSIGDDKQVADCISKIGISSRFLLSLINDILDMSRIESGKMLLKNEKIPVEDFLNGINSICFSQANVKGVEYECIIDPMLDDYYIGDAMKLQQVIINILGNAIKFTGEGGKVTFSAALHKKDKNNAVLRFIVNDTGTGMSEEFLPHIFEPFAQESTGTTALYGGTGLGLSISKNIVDMMDGKITVRSIKDIGTEFTVDVKLGITDEEKHRHNQKKQDYNFSYLKTLVVDDDVAVCESAVVTLREMGITAQWVDTGRKAVDLVRSLWNNGKYFDMILIDWKMPEMDGIETARQIRGIVGPEVTIIIMTAYDWAAIEHEAKMAGVNLLMSKPMFKSSLVSAFTRALGVKEEQARKEQMSDYDFTGKRVLLAEDNAINTEVAVLLLESKGFTVESAQNGLRAMEMFSKSQEGYYDAILMDIRMPLMDGLAATVNIRHLSNADARTIPIIAMTANAFDDDIEKSKAAGMNAHLAKPIDPERLYQTLYDFIFAENEDVC